MGTGRGPEEQAHSVIFTGVVVSSRERQESLDDLREQRQVVRSNPKTVESLHEEGGVKPARTWSLETGCLGKASESPPGLNLLVGSTFG